MPARPLELDRVVGPWLVGSPDEVIDAEILQLLRNATPDDGARALLLGPVTHSLVAQLEAAGFATDGIPLNRLTRSHLESRAQEFGAAHCAFLIERELRAERILGDEAYADVLGWLAEHVTVTVFSAPRRAIMPGIADLGPYRAQSIVDAFLFVHEHRSAATESSLALPRLLASSQSVLLEGRWRPIHDPAVYPPSRSGARTWRMGDDIVVKTEAASEDYLERSQVGQEGRFLSAQARVGGGDLGLPHVLELTLGRSVNTLIRQRVPGHAPLQAVTDDETRQSLVALAASYARVGLFHNDIRPWNVLIDGTRAHFIDYADVREFESDTEGVPQILALATTLARLSLGTASRTEDFARDAWALWRSSELASHVAAGELFTHPWLELGRREEVAIDWTSPDRILTSLLRSTLGLDRGHRS